MIWYLFSFLLCCCSHSHLPLSCSHNLRATSFRHPVTGQISPENTEYTLQDRWVGLSSLPGNDASMNISRGQLKVTLLEPRNRPGSSLSSSLVEHFTIGGLWLGVFYSASAATQRGRNWVAVIERAQQDGQCILLVQTGCIHFYHGIYSLLLCSHMLLDVNPWGSSALFFKDCFNIIYGNDTVWQAHVIFTTFITRQQSWSCPINQPSFVNAGFIIKIMVHLSYFSQCISSRKSRNLAVCYWLQLWWSLPKVSPCKLRFSSLIYCYIYWHVTEILSVALE